MHKRMIPQGNAHEINMLKKVGIYCQSQLPQI